jgi:hypothetical protein
LQNLLGNIEDQQCYQSFPATDRHLNLHEK